MPELPEVETVRRGLAPVLEGRRIVRARALRPDLRFPLPDGFGQMLTGRRVTGVGRRAKYLLIGLDNDTTLIAHLGMSGSFRIYMDSAPPLATHDHVVLETDGGAEIRYNDPRRFGFMDMIHGDGADHPMLKKLGPEPLGGDFHAARLAAALKGRKAPIKAALLDQSVVAGLGNIYVCEALFRSGISPKRKAATVQGGRARRLHQAIRDVLGEAIAAGGSSISDHRQTDGELGYFQHSFAVYGREGEACPGCDCDPGRTGGVRRIVQSGRSTFYCAKRQR
ncbi:MAG: bifunctional DNA-formamidopyrimidine glycosylase/DNA-(apurinic or apyrimidinic site) lyase [Rhodospirillaceae bacterium]|nr:bifunctional DNA-formamidopyrimidine glycosylase/DNA-(apurinic or apyrimidinic site) lyase [Rhodospirillaceae bacterium]